MTTKIRIAIDTERALAAGLDTCAGVVDVECDPSRWSVDERNMLASMTSGRAALLASKYAPNVLANANGGPVCSALPTDEGVRAALSEMHTRKEARVATRAGALVARGRAMDGLRRRFCVPMASDDEAQRAALAAFPDSEVDARMLPLACAHLASTFGVEPECVAIVPREGGSLVRVEIHPARPDVEVPGISLVRFYARKEGV